mgnify:CR=1 FL=1
MLEDDVLEAVAELRKWTRRRSELIAELKRVNEQVSYYEGLVRDMKDKLSPSTLSRLLDSLIS